MWKQQCAVELYDRVPEFNSTLRTLKYNRGGTWRSAVNVNCVVNFVSDAGTNLTQKFLILQVKVRQQTEIGRKLCSKKSKRDLSVLTKCLNHNISEQQTAKAVCLLNYTNLSSRCLAEFIVEWRYTV